MSEAEAAGDLSKRDREAEQAFESIALNFARHAVLPHTVDCGLERGECRLHRAKVGRIGLNPLVAGEDGRVWDRRTGAIQATDQAMPSTCQRQRQPTPRGRDRKRLEHQRGDGFFCSPGQPRVPFPCYTPITQHDEQIEGEKR